MRYWLPGWVVTILLLVARDMPLCAQPAAPQFEFVSVRRVPALCGAFELNLRCERQTPPRSSSRVFAGGRLEVTNQLAIDLVRVAYGLESLDPRYLSGGPRWMESERYDIIALTGDDGRPEQGSLPTANVRLMLRGLLEDRFKLRVRIVPKKTEVFVLSRTDSAARGPGLKQSSGQCREPSFSWDLPECARTAGGRFDAANVSMPELTAVLSHLMRLPVVDETGIDGRYDVSLGLGRRDEASMSAGLQRDLGLELRRAKKAIERVEIENAERPVED